MTAETLDDRLKHPETSGSAPAAVPVALAATRNPTTVTPPPASQTSADQNGQSSKEKVGENPRGSEVTHLTSEVDQEEALPSAGSDD